MKDEPLSRKAFKKLFLDNFRPLTVYAMQFVKDLEVSEDIVQDVFLYIYEKRGSYQIQDQGRYHLYKLVRYRCLNYLEHKRIRIESNPGVQESMNANPDDPLEMVELIELESRYLQALESLSPKCRMVFEMSRIEGKSNQEIADELKLSKRTVESHISLAIKVLRKKLKKYL